MTKETKFIIFCIESYKVYKSLSGKQTFNLFNDYGVINYLTEFYDVLHSTGHQYIVRDIDEYLKARGAVIPC